MTLAVLAYFAGILSPCILPVLPFVFARAGQPFLRGTLPMLVGMALTLALVASLDALGGGWAAEADEYGRLAAMIILAGFGIILLFPAIVERVTRPIVSLGAQNFLGADGIVNDTVHVYGAEDARRNEWGLTGRWNVGPERADLTKEGGGIHYRFRARDLHLVPGSGSGDKQVRFPVTIDGKAPGDDHGLDTGPEDNGTVTKQRSTSLRAGTGRSPTTQSRSAFPIRASKPTHSPSVEETAMKRIARISTLFAGMGIALAGLLSATTSAGAQEGLAIPAPVLDEENAASRETAVFAGGCFWGVQGVFQRVEGVSNAVSGYAGGAQETAHYEMVGNGDTGHAEAVRVTFDPAKVTYGKLLQVYFSVAHDPTQLNRQGPDTGPQYRSTLFPTSEEQAGVAKAYIEQLNKARIYDAAIVTTIEPDKVFYPAENYHQDFLTNNPTYPYIVYNDMPKIDNLKRLFPADFRSDPVLVAKVGIGE